MSQLRASYIFLGVITPLLVWGVFSAQPHHVNGQIASTTENVGISITISDGSEIGGGGSPVKNPAAVSFTGLTSPDALVTITKGGKVIGTVHADSSGVFKKDATVDYGFTTFGLWSKDKNGLNSQTSAITINLNPNSSIAISNIFLSPTISGSRALAEKGTTIRIFGSTYPNSTVQIFNNFATPSLGATTQASTDGSWEYLIDTEDLSEGEYSYKVRAQSPTSVTSPFSEDIKFTIGEILCTGADFNKDGGVNIADFSIMLFYWGPLRDPATLTNLCVDLNKDERVNIFDFSVLMYEWTN